MLDVETKLIEIFCHVNDNNQIFIRGLRTHRLSDGSGIMIKLSRLSEGGVMTNVFCFI